MRLLLLALFHLLTCLLTLIKRPPALTLLVILLAYALRVHKLGAQDLWGDEAGSLWLSLEGLGRALEVLSRSEPHPPLYPALLWAWLGIAGKSEFAARYPSVLFGAITVPLIFSLGKRIGGASMGMVAALLVALSPFLVWHSQEVRMYPAAAALVTGSTLFLIRALEGGRWGRPGYVAVSALAAYTHYYALYVLLAHALFLLYQASRHRIALGRWIAAYLMLGVIYLPWTIAAAHIFVSYYGAAPGTIDLPRVLLSTLVRLGVGWTLEGHPAYILGGVALLLVGLGAVRLWVKEGRGSQKERAIPQDFAGLVLLFWLLVPLTMGFLVSLVRPMFAERYFIVVAPPYYLLLAIGIQTHRGRLHLAVPGMLFLLGVSASSLLNYYTDSRYIKSQYSLLTRQMEGMLQPGEAAVLDGPSQILMYRYYARRPPPTYLLPERVPLDESATASVLDDLARRHSGIWLFLNSTADYDPQSFIERWLSEHAYRAEQRWATNGRLVYYALIPDQRLIERPLAALAEERLELVSYALLDEDYSAGQVVPVLLRWRARTPLGERLKVSLRLRGGDGFLWGQTDGEPVGGFRPTTEWRPGEVVDDRYGVRIVPGTPPGSYVLELRLYEEETGRQWSFKLGQDGSEEAVSLGSVRVGWPGRMAGIEVLPDFAPVSAVFGEELELLGYAASPRAQAGREVYLTLLWRALADMAEDYLLRVRLTEVNGHIWYDGVLPPTNGGFPTSRWRAGDVLRGQYNFLLDPRIPAGQLLVSIALVHPTGEEVPVTADRIALQDGSNGLVIHHIQILPRPQAKVASQPRVKLSKVLGGKAALRGYTLENRQSRPGETIKLTLYWEALSRMERSYTVFTHLLDSESRVRGQKDSLPHNGDLPTTSWIPGELIEDRYEIPVQADAPAGEYQIEVGLYDASTGERLPVLDEAGHKVDDRVLLEVVEVSRED